MILRPYQEVGRDFLASRRHALLADEMRVGKTPQAILAAHKIGAQTVLVVCPAIAVAHWESEFRKWWPISTLPRTHIMSYQRATTLWQAGLKGTVDVFVPDEAHFAKNPEAQRTKMVYGKTGFAQRAGATWPLSGTPAPKNAAELWPMLRAFGAVGMTYREFIKRYCEFNEWTQRITGTKVAMIPELRGILNKVMLRRKRLDVAPDMPAIDFQFLEVEPVSQADLNIPTWMPDSQLIEHLETRSNADREDRMAVAHAKALPLVENVAFAVENGLLEKTVVFGWHVAPLEAVVAGLRARGIRAELINGATSAIRRVEIQNYFRHGSLQVVVANILAAGTAIDLSAASHGYFLELDWVPGTNLQAANRLISMDKAEGVTFDICTWPGSADDRVQRVLMRRANELSQLY